MSLGVYPLGVSTWRWARSSVGDGMAAKNTEPESTGDQIHVPMCHFVTLDHSADISGLPIPYQRSLESAGTVSQVASSCSVPRVSVGLACGGGQVFTAAFTPLLSDAAIFVYPLCLWCPLCNTGTVMAMTQELSDDVSWWT